jgi:copper chaperone
MEKTVLKVDGMSCEHCVRAVTNAVSGISGTQDVSVDLKSGTVSFSFDSGKAALDAVAAAIIEEGFTVRR